MNDLLLILAHLLTTLPKLLGPGGAKAIVADSLLKKQQLIVINRSRRRAPNLTVMTGATRFLVTISKPTPHSEGSSHSPTLSRP